MDLQVNIQVNTEISKKHVQSKISDLKVNIIEDNNTISIRFTRLGQ